MGIDLAQASNIFIFSAMAVYTVALYFFAAELAFAPRLSPPPPPPPPPPTPRG